MDELGVPAEMRGAQASMTEVLQYDKPEARKEGKKFEGDEADTVKQAMELLVSEAKFLA